LVWWSVTHPETTLAILVSDDHVSAIQTDALGTSSSELR